MVIAAVLLSQDMMSMQKAEIADGVVVVLGIVVVDEAGGVRWSGNS